MAYFRVLHIDEVYVCSDGVGGDYILHLMTTKLSLDTAHKPSVNRAQRVLSSSSFFRFFFFDVLFFHIYLIIGWVERIRKHLSRAIIDLWGPHLIDFTTLQESRDHGQPFFSSFFRIQIMKVLRKAVRQAGKKKKYSSLWGDPRENRTLNRFCQRTVKNF